MVLHQARYPSHDYGGVIVMKVYWTELSLTRHTSRNPYIDHPWKAVQKDLVEVSWAVTYTELPRKAQHIAIYGIYLQRVLVVFR